MTAPSLSPERHTELAETLHADVDGDFLVAASGFGEDIALNQAGIADVVRWALNAASPLVARWLAEDAHQAEAWGEHTGRAEALGTCPHSGATFADCKGGVCDCFQYDELAAAEKRGREQVAADVMAALDNDPCEDNEDTLHRIRAALVPGHDHEEGK